MCFNEKKKEKRRTKKVTGQRNKYDNVQKNIHGATKRSSVNWDKKCKKATLY